MKFVAYYRTSTQKQEYGLEAQRKIVEEYVSGTGRTIEKDFYEMGSGKNNFRPQILKAIKFAKDNDCTIIVSALDRLSRNPDFIDELRNNSVKFLALDCQSEREEHLAANYAEKEQKLISERTKAGLAIAKTRGVRLGNPRPTESLKRAASSIQQRKRAFADCLAKTIVEIQESGAKNLTKIAETLNKNGVKTRRNGTWTATAVKRVLSATASSLNNGS